MQIDGVANTFLRREDQGSSCLHKLLAKPVSSIFRYEDTEGAPHYETLGVMGQLNHFMGVQLGVFIYQQMIVVWYHLRAQENWVLLENRLPICKQVSFQKKKLLLPFMNKYTLLFG